MFSQLDELSLTIMDHISEFIKRWQLPKEIEETETFREQLNRGLVCFGEFQRAYNKKYVQPIKRRFFSLIFNVNYSGLIFQST